MEGRFSVAVGLGFARHWNGRGVLPGPRAKEENQDREARVGSVLFVPTLGHRTPTECHTTVRYENEIHSHDVVRLKWKL